MFFLFFMQKLGRVYSLANWFESEIKKKVLYLKYDEDGNRLNKIVLFNHYITNSEKYENDRLFEYFAIILCVKCNKNRTYMLKMVDFMCSQNRGESRI